MSNLFREIYHLVKHFDYRKSNNRLYLESYYQGFQQKEVFNTIEKYCMFIGYPRSGHTLVGSLLDAHPEIVIAQELDALRYLQKNYNQRQIYSLILQNSQEFTETGRNCAGYSYIVPHQWQGKFDKLKIIGDKKGAGSTKLLGENRELLNILQETIDVPIKFIHVVRNPYDNISTLYKNKCKIEQKKNNKDKLEISLESSIEYYFNLCEIIKDLKLKIETNNLLDIKHELVIDNPQEALIKLCDFLDIKVSDEYLNNCASIVFKSHSKTRNSIKWTSEDIELVKQKINGFDFLQEYSYEN